MVRSGADLGQSVEALLLPFLWLGFKGRSASHIPSATNFQMEPGRSINRRVAKTCWKHLLVGPGFPVWAISAAESPQII
jgi:hypothetical protein